MIQVKQAVSEAIAFFRGLRPQVTNLRVEEVEIEDRGWWSVTLGFTPEGVDESRAEIFGKQLEREYRVITIADDGEVRAMKMRK